MQLVNYFHLALASARAAPTSPTQPPQKSPFLLFFSPFFPPFFPSSADLTSVVSYPSYVLPLP